MGDRAQREAPVAGAAEDARGSVEWIWRLPLFYRVLGPRGGYPLVFLHGITGSHRYWVRKAAPLAKEFRLLLPDLPGFGRSPKPDVDYTPDLFLEALRGLLTRMDLADRPLAIVGHSLGSIVAAEYARRYPRGVERLVLMSVPRFNDSELAHRIYWLGSPSYRKLLRQHSVRENLAQARRTGWGLTLRSLCSMPWGAVADCRRFTLRSLTSTIENCLLHYRVDPLLPSLERFPVLMIHGHRDQVAPYAHIEDLPARFSNIRLITLPTSGHHAFLTDTRKVRRLVRDFVLDGRPSGPARL